MALGGAPPLEAQTGSSCPVSIGKQIEAVAAFAEMLPVFRHARCMNCHGGLDPTSDAHPGADQLEPNSNPLVFAEQCQMCHDGLPGWRQPDNLLFFVGKSDEQLCLQMKKFERTGEEFVSHIFNDHGPDNIQFIAAAFVGDRALGEGLADYRLVVEKPPGSQAELTAKARKWTELVGEGYSASEECGCLVKLQGKFTYKDSLTAQTFTRVTGNLVWKPEKGEQRSSPTFGDVQSTFFRPTEGEITIEEEFVNYGFGGPGKCAGSGRKTFSMDQLAQGALRHMLLEIAADGRYKVTLVIPDNPDPFPRWKFDSTCTFPNVTAHEPVEVRYVAVVLGRQQGVVDDNGINGQLQPPIRRGPRFITGDWSFTASQR